MTRTVSGWRILAFWACLVVACLAVFVSFGALVWWAVS